MIYKEVIINNKTVKLKGTRFFNVMFNIVDLGKILNKNPFEYLESSDGKKLMNALKSEIKYHQVIDGYKQLKIMQPEPDDCIVDIQGSEEVYVHPVFISQFTDHNHDVNIRLNHEITEFKFFLEKTK